MDYSMKAWLLFAVTMVIWAGPARSAAKVFTVGDSTGWTSRNNPNYAAWASGKTFRVGDTILFKYIKEFHNVLEVNQADYIACKNSSYMKEYNTGDDSILIKTTGHHYFICGVPGHCQLGQRVDILAVGAGEAPSAAPSSSPSSNGLSMLHAPSAGDRFAGAMTAACAIILLGL